MSASHLLVVLCTVPSERAERLASQLVEARLAACVNVLPSVRSIYRWRGAVTRDEESQLVIKTTAARWEALSAFVVANHGYEVPELLAIDVPQALPAYAAWVRDETREEEPSS